MAINQPQFQDLGLKMVYTPKLPPMFMGKLIENYEQWMIFWYPHFQTLLRTIPESLPEVHPVARGVTGTPSSRCVSARAAAAGHLFQHLSRGCREYPTGQVRSWLKMGGLNMGLVLDKLRILPP